MNNSIIQNQTAVSKKPANTMLAYINRMQDEIKKALPSVITPERFTRIVMTAISSNPQLQSCTPQSFLGAMMQAAQLGVEVNTPLQLGYLIPYRNKGTMEAQFQLGYRGMIELAYRSGEVANIQAHCVYENDEFTYSYGLNPDLIHKPATGDRGEMTHVYAVVTLKNGGMSFEVASIDDVRRHAKKYSKSFGSASSPWQTSFDEMAKKTVLKNCLKYAPLRSDFVRGMTADETIKTEISSDMFTINDTTDYAEENIVDVDVETGEVKTDVEKPENDV